MAHTRYSLTDVYSGEPLEQLLYVSSASYGPDWNSRFHSHSFLELFYVAGGSGYFCTEDEELPIKKDTLIIINPNINHTERSSVHDPLTYIVLGVDNLCFDFHEGPNTFHLYDLALHKTLLLPLLKSMLSELKQKAHSYEQICQHFLSILLLRITRITGASCLLLNYGSSSPECEQVKRYINAHFRDPLTLDVLSRLVHLNKYYLAHIFTDAYGIPPIRYLQERRILCSKDLLKNTDLTITQTAQLAGFSSSNYFTQVFKKETGISPQLYRQKHRSYH